jgi:hypothetical protein
MLFAILLAVATAQNPLEEVRLTQMQMFDLQRPYRYHVRVATYVKHQGAQMYELEAEDIYANVIRPKKLIAPEDKRFPKAATEYFLLEMDDVLTFPDDRFHHVAGFILEGGPSLLVINDRQEKKTIWPPVPPEP